MGVGDRRCSDDALIRPEGRPRHAQAAAQTKGRGLDEGVVQGLGRRLARGRTLTVEGLVDIPATGPGNAAEIDRS